VVKVKIVRRSLFHTKTLRPRANRDFRNTQQPRCRIRASKFHQSAAADLQHVALENPDGQQVLVVTNTGPARTIELRLANMAASVPLKANSVTTLAWR
jgi:O-glycosyl hydrolase